MLRLLPGATLADTMQVSREMRYADRMEVWRGARMQPFEALSVSLEGSRNVFRIECPKEGVIALGGCSPLPADPAVGLPWMLGTEGITRRWRAFGRLTPAIWGTVERDYRFLWNMVDAHNRLHVRWLEWSGCRFGPTRIINDHPFLEFSRECASP